MPLIKSSSWKLSSEIPYSKYQKKTQAGFIAHCSNASLPGPNPHLTSADQDLSSKPCTYFYSLGAPDDDRGLSPVMKDVGTFFIPDGNTTPAVSYGSCLSLTWVVFCYHKVWTPTAGLQVALLFTIFERRLAGDSHILQSYFAEERESCVIIKNENILTNKTNNLYSLPWASCVHFQEKTYQCIAFRIYALFFLPWPFFCLFVL